MKDAASTDGSDEDDDGEDGRNGAASNAGPRLPGMNKNDKFVVASPVMSVVRSPNQSSSMYIDDDEYFPLLGSDAEVLANGYFLMERDGEFYVYDECGDPVFHCSSREEAIEEAYSRKPPYSNLGI